MIANKYNISRVHGQILKTLQSYYGDEVSSFNKNKDINSKIDYRITNTNTNNIYKRRFGNGETGRHYLGNGEIYYMYQRYDETALFEYSIPDEIVWKDPETGYSNYVSFKTQFRTIDMGEYENEITPFKSLSVFPFSYQVFVKDVVPEDAIEEIIEFEGSIEEVSSGVVSDFSGTTANNLFRKFINKIKGG